METSKKIIGVLSGKEINADQYQIYLQIADLTWDYFIEISNLYSKLLDREFWWIENHSESIDLSGNYYSSNDKYFLNFIDTIVRYGNTLIISNHQITDDEALADELNNRIIEAKK